MKTEKLVSIVVPVYQVEAYLTECIESICNQDYPNMEIVLVDDGSLDNSGKICDEYAQKDSRVYVIHQQNSGAAIAKNTGLDYAHGEYIMIVDADDYISAGTVSKAVATAEQQNADIVVFQFYKLFKDRLEEDDSIKEPTGFNTEEYLSLFTTDWRCSLPWGKLFVKHTLNGVRFRNERRCIDDEFFTYKAVMNAKKIFVIPDIFYFYRQRGGSATKNDGYRRQKTLDAIENITERCRVVTKAHPALKKKYMEHWLQMMVYVGNSFFMDKDTVVLLKKQLLRAALGCLRWRTSIGEIIEAAKLLATSSDDIIRKNHNSAYVAEKKETLFE